VESANKVVVEDRLKGSGMHWAPTSVDPLLALRTVVCADRWDEAWPQISTRLRTDARTRSRQLRAERRAARQAGQAAGQAPAAPQPETVSSLPALTSLVMPTPPAPKTIIDGHPTKAHP
jgi:hypothetical protein